MDESISQHADAPSKSLLVLAIVTPFAAIALLAAPLFLDALRHLTGL
jgi:hypothetical protein